jgi:hypothetical protein
MANSGQSELDEIYRRASGEKRVRSSLKTDDTAVATIYETSHEKPSAALTATVLQLDEHEDARSDCAEMGQPVAREIRNDAKTAPKRRARTSQARVTTGQRARDWATVGAMNSEEEPGRSFRVIGE